MATKYHIKASPPPGFDYVFRAKRGWPASGTEVEVDHSAKEDDFGRGVITKETLDALQADPRISVTMAGGEKEIGGLRKLTAQHEEELLALRRRCAELEAELATRDQALASLRETINERRAPAPVEASREIGEPTEVDPRQTELPVRPRRSK